MTNLIKATGSLLILALTAGILALSIAQWTTQDLGVPRHIQAHYTQLKQANSNQ